MRTFLLGVALALCACGDGHATSVPDANGDASPLTDGAHPGDAASASDAASQGDGGAQSGGRTGLAGECDRYKACGGSYYATAQDCIDAAVGYWGTCRQSYLDAFGDCMRVQDCSIAGSDGYIPSQTPCASQYAALESSPGC